jgi:hypothetical protein
VRYVFQHAYALGCVTKEGHEVLETKDRRHSPAVTSNAPTGAKGCEPTPDLSTQAAVDWYLQSTFEVPRQAPVVDRMSKRNAFSARIDVEPIGVNRASRFYNDD